MKKERGAITLFVIMGMLFFIIALINIYVMSVNRKQSQLQILEQANGAYDENAEDIYKISTYVFSKDLITEHTHYMKKIYSFDVDSTITYKKISNAVELPPERQDTQQPQEPKVGMTKEEVERSTWGYPKKINKDTYSWGTKEQWVYDRGYIYFRNDVVTSISER